MNMTAQAPATHATATADCTTNRHRAFVYGTLKRGFNNHALLVRGQAQFLHTAITQGRYRMTCVGFPCVQTATGRGTRAAPVARVEGEVWLVSDVCLRALDRLESEGHMYARRQVELQGHPAAMFYEWLDDTMPGRQVVPDSDGVYRWQRA